MDAHICVGCCIKISPKKSYVLNVTQNAVFCPECAFRLNIIDSSEYISMAELWAQIDGNGYIEVINPSRDIGARPYLVKQEFKLYVRN